MIKSFFSSLSISYDNSPLENYLLPSIFHEFKILEENTYLHIKTSDYRERKNELLSRKTDLIFTVKDNIETSEGVVYKELYQSKMFYVATINDRFSGKEVVELSDIGNRPLILLNPIKCPMEMSRIQSRIQDALPESIVYYSDSAAITYIMIKSNAGVAIMPGFICPMDEGLISIPVNIPDAISYGIAYLKENSSPRLKSLINIIQMNFSKNRTYFQ